MIRYANKTFSEREQGSFSPLKQNYNQFVQSYNYIIIIVISNRAIQNLCNSNICFPHHKLPPKKSQSAFENSDLFKRYERYRTPCTYILVNTTEIEYLKKVQDIVSSTYFCQATIAKRIQKHAGMFKLYGRKGNFNSKA